MRFSSMCVLALLAPSLVFAGEWQSPQRITMNDSAIEQGRFVVASDTIESAVKDALIERDVAEHVEATLTSTANPVLYQSRVPVTLALHSLQVNTAANQWQAQAYILSNNQTVSVIPVSGRYEALREVPVLKHHMAAGETIRSEDITTTLIPERQLRRDVLADATDIIGKTPKRGVSAKRPIRGSEVGTPRLVEKGKMVELRYTTAYMSIQSRGEALENGSLGESIRIKNLDTERAISGRVVGTNLIEVNLAAPIETAASYK